MARSKDSFSEQVIGLIDSVVEPLEKAGLAVDPELVAVEVDSMIDPKQLSPALKTHCSILQIKDFTRKRLAARHDPVERMKEFIEYGEDEQIGLFGEELQPYYPVRREPAPGEKSRPVYIPREQLTAADVKRICRRLSRAGDALLRHARNLEAWFISFQRGDAA